MCLKNFIIQKTYKIYFIGDVMKKRKKNKKKNKNEIVAELQTDLKNIKRELKHDVTPAVVASFGFIIALIWRDAIKSGIDEFLTRAGLLDKAYLYNFVSAIIVTFIVIFIMIVIAKWGRKKKKRKIKKVIRRIENFEEEKGRNKSKKSKR